ncbi:MAG TPA: alpha/beta hydrolase [Chloroflexota bacterium]|nr:alpha/beta hydrolase [Chloroflexota bacterium]
MRWVAASETAPRSYTVEHLARLDVPTLWIAGENDPTLGLDQLLTLKARIPGAEILIVHHAGHHAHRTHPHLVGPAMMDVLTRHDAPHGR